MLRRALVPEPVRKLQPRDGTYLCSGFDEFSSTRQDDSQVSNRLSFSYGRSSTTVKIFDEFANLMRVGALRIAFGISAIRCEFVILFRVARKQGIGKREPTFHC
jgi:hypothetical protein